MSFLENVIANNILICLYIMVLYYLLTPTKTISATEYLYYFMIGTFVIIPLTGYIQYNLFFNFLSTPSFAGAYLGPIEEITKIIIPVFIIHIHPKRKSMSVTDFVLISVAIGSAFSLFENLLYFRTAFSVDIGTFNVITGSKFYSEYNFESITFFNHFLYPALISVFLGLKNRFSKSIVLSILFYCLSVITLAYSMFIHGFYNYCEENSFLGIIKYPDNKFVVFIYEKLCLSGKYLDIIFMAILIGIVIFELICLYKTSKQPGSHLTCYFSYSYQKQVLTDIFKGKYLRHLAFNSLYKKYLFYLLFAGIDAANNKYENKIQKHTSDWQLLLNKTGVNT